MTRVIFRGYFGEMGRFLPCWVGDCVPCGASAGDFALAVAVRVDFEEVVVYGVGIDLLVRGV